MSATIEVKYFNSFLLRKTVDANNNDLPAYKPATTTTAKNWIIEESRIKGRFNGTSVGFGPRAYLVSENNSGSIRFNSLIYSGIFNSRTGINETNVFPVGEDISRSLDPQNGSIQKLYAENTNLTILQEDKVSRALIDKNAIYSAEGSAITTSGAVIIGQIVPYAGEYGISKDPGSFAVYGFRKYFTDRRRSAVLRLSQDGITEISSYGMRDFFRDELNNLDSGTNQIGVVKGGWDTHSKSYVTSFQPWEFTPTDDSNYKTLAFDEGPKGWVSFYNYKPSQIFSLKNNFYTTNGNKIHRHYAGNYGEFYGVSQPSTVTLIFNPQASLSKNFKTINYEGTSGWKVNSIVSDATEFDTVSGTPTAFNDSALPIASYEEGQYILFNNSVIITPSDPAFFSLTTSAGYFIQRYGFDRKENKYTSAIKNNSQPRSNEVIHGSSMSGIKGYLATVQLSTDATTSPTEKKELFAVSSNYVESSY